MSPTAKLIIAPSLCFLLAFQASAASLTVTKPEEVGFSAERLFRCLNDLGQEVEITIRPSQKGGRRGGIHVVATDAEATSGKGELDREADESAYECLLFLCRPCS